MKINCIQKTYFKGKNLTPKIQENAKLLLEKMNQETIYSRNSSETSWNSSILCRLNLDKKTQFVDKRCLLAPINNPQERSGKCSLQLGKAELEFDANKGEIIKYNKPFFRTWKSLLKQTSDVLETMVDNFNNSDVVSKSFIRMTGFTEKGIDLLSNKSNNTSRHKKKY